MPYTFETQPLPSLPCLTSFMKDPLPQKTSSSKVLSPGSEHCPHWSVDEQWLLLWFRDQTCSRIECCLVDSHFYQECHSSYQITRLVNTSLLCIPTSFWMLAHLKSGQKLVLHFLTFSLVSRCFHTKNKKTVNWAFESQLRKDGWHPNAGRRPEGSPICIY